MGCAGVGPAYTALGICAVNELLEILLIGLFTLVLVVWLIHVLARRISKRIGENVHDPTLEPNRQPLIRPGFVLTLVCIFLGLPLLWSISLWWPPQWIERREQRNRVALRIVEAGGFSNLVQACAAFASTNQSSTYLVSSFHTNVVYPREMLVMKPRQIRCEQWKGIAVVKLQLFGMHSSGGRDTPFYSLIVVTEKTPGDVTDTLEHDLGGRMSIRKLAEGVFEVY